MHVIRDAISLEIELNCEEYLDNPGQKPLSLPHYFQNIVEFIST